MIPSIGGIEGNTPIEVIGTNFGGNPSLYLGGQSLLIDRYVLAADSGDGKDHLFARTVPNYAGPAAVKVIRNDGLSDIVMGAFTYVDLLKISYVNPPVVKVSQAGAGDRVSVVGYGFHGNIKLKAWQSGRPETAVDFTPDKDRLILYSAERMIWQVPGFGGAYRGFVDVSIENGTGSRYVLPKALFYGHLQVNRQLEPENPESFGSIPDPVKLPPGKIAGITSDPGKGLIYVLGQGLPMGGVSPEKTVDIKTFEAWFAPGWISLVHYKRNELENAAPMHQLGYYNLPQDLIPRTLHLSGSQLYVSAEGYHFPYIDTHYEDQKVILVYDREDRLPGDIDPDFEGKDRDIIYSLNLDFKEVPVSLASSGKLLFAASPADGVAVITLADPKRPAVIRVLKYGRANGNEVTLSPARVETAGGVLYVSNASGRTFSFDIGKPSLPQTGFDERSGVQRMVPESVRRLKSSGPLDFRMDEVNSGGYSIPLGAFDPQGFDFRLPGEFRIKDIFSQTTLGGVNTEYFQKQVTRDAYLTLYDFSRPETISLLDALRINLPLRDNLISSTMGRDGIVAVASQQRLLLVDPLTADLSGSDPLSGATGVPKNKVLSLTFTIPVGSISMPEGKEISDYIALVRDDGTENGILAETEIAISDSDPKTIRITPVAPLESVTRYRFMLKGVLGSRRTLGLFDHEIAFTTGTGTEPPPEIVSVEPSAVNTTGGEIEVIVRNAVASVFTLAGVNAPEISQEAIADDKVRFVIQVPENTAGPATLIVINQGGAKDTLPGAVVYYKPLVLNNILPISGSINGGTTVTVKGAGFQAGLSTVKVTFNDIPVPDTDVFVLDSETLKIITPPGRLGPADITVSLDNGQSAALADAFHYQQPVQSRIVESCPLGNCNGRIYDLALDPTGVYLVAAAGTGGVYIYNIDASTYTSGSAQPLNPDDLQKMVDLNHDGHDDRILVKFPLPGGYMALGVDTYFERQTDRVVVTAVIPGEPESARLFILGFDSGQIKTPEIICSLPLFANLARGIDAENDLAVIAMGTRGIGLVDIHLQTKAYLADRFSLPDGQSALDVVRIPYKAEATGKYVRFVAASGEFDINANRLTDAPGGFYIIEHNTAEGFRILGQIDIAASRIALDGEIAYLAAGSAGLVIVDISDPTRPAILSRLMDIGHVHDVAVNGCMVYLALGERGIVPVDVTDPARPLIVGGMQTYKSEIQAVVAGNYMGIGAGRTEQGARVVQVTPDTALKIFLMNPADGILDKDAEGNLKIILRFNKAIDQWPANLNRFDIRGPGGTLMATDVSIISNDAILKLLPGHGLALGDRISVTARAGIESAKTVDSGQTIVMYTLARDRAFELKYRGSRPDALRIDSVAPHRISLNTRRTITVSGTGIPVDSARVRVLVNGAEARVISITQHAGASGAAVISAGVPPIAVAGQYDVNLLALISGIWQSATCAGGLIVDTPISFERIIPRWGPVTGGTTVTVFGKGFEPGNTVMDGLRIRIGDVPVAGIRVLSNERMEIVTRGAAPGQYQLRGEDSYGNVARLSAENGFGYGLKRIGGQMVDFHPTDVRVDQQTGVAITSGGYFHDGYAFQEFEGLPIPDSIRAAVFDIQTPENPILVGGAPALPSGEAGREDIRRFVELFGLRNKIDALTPAEAEQLEILQGYDLATSLDSIRILPAEDMKNGILHKRLYVASGGGGMTMLNLDDQNGLQFISQVLDETSEMQVGDIDRKGCLGVAARQKIGPADPGRNPCDHSQAPVGESGKIERINYTISEDPVLTGWVSGLSGSNVVRFNGSWVYTGGERPGIVWKNIGQCMLSRQFTAARPENGTSGTITAVDLFDPMRTREFSFDNNVRDIVFHGDYLITALGGSGIDICHKERPEKRASLKIDASIQQNQGDVVRLRRFGSLLLVSAAAGGLVLVDIAEPMSPRIVSAGNIEPIESFDYYKGRLVGVSGGNGLTVFDLPGALVTSVSVDEDGAIGESELYGILFNEPVTIASLEAPGAVSVTRVDSGLPVEFTITPINPGEGSAQRYSISFERSFGVRYKIVIRKASNLRGGSLWVPFVGHVRAATSGSARPRIDAIEGGVFHRGDNRVVTIKGEGFRNSTDLKVFIGQYELSLEWINENTLRLPAGSIEMLPLAPGEHHLRVSDNVLTADFPGAIVMGESLDQVVFQISPNSGSIEGGRLVKISTNKTAMLPGARVILRSENWDDIRSEMISGGIYVRDLKDDVVDLKTFEFRLPEVDAPGICQIYLEMGGKEVRIGDFSYTGSAGRRIDLPNYPPMRIGAIHSVGDLLYVGVSGVSVISPDNRYLMKSGFEIYDIAIREHPIRLSQFPTDHPVTGVEVFGNTAYLASGSDGLIVVDITDPAKPLRICNFAVPNQSATDLALDRNRNILAMAVANPLGGGYIRFFDISDPDLDPPAGYGTISLTDGDIAGTPLNIEWLDDRLYVLLLKEKSLYLAIFDFGGESQPTLQPVDRGDVFLNSADIAASGISMTVAYGQIGIKTENAYLILRQTAAGDYKTDYWIGAGDASNAVCTHQGAVFIADAEGITDVASPYLAVTRFEPPPGATLVPGETVRIQLNKLINTDEAVLRQGIRLFGPDSAELPFDAYSLEGINTLAGGYIDLILSEGHGFGEHVRLSVDGGIRTLSGTPLATGTAAFYYVVTGKRPVVDRVCRIISDAPSLHYFHGDGSETAEVRGSNFGTDPAAIEIIIGDTAVASILSINDTTIRFVMPAIPLSMETASLPVWVTRAGVKGGLNGAVIIQPGVMIQGVSPESGPPEGGNRVKIYGRGFNHQTIISFGGVRAGDLKLFGSGYLEVRAPSGSFGHVPVSAESRLFTGEISTLPDAYFYTGKATGSVDLSGNGFSSNPVVGMAVGNQILYAITGGGYSAIDTRGNLISRLSAANGQLVVVDTTDPVHPQVIEKLVANVSGRFFMDVALPPDGFRDICLAGDNLFLAGGSRLYHLDVTLPADPLVLREIQLPGTAGRMVHEDGTLYVSTTAGLVVFRVMPDREIRELAVIGAAKLGGVPGSLAIKDDRLWVAVTYPSGVAAGIIALDLSAGDFRIVHSVALGAVTPEDFLIRNDLLIVGTGAAGLINAYAIRPDGAGYLVGKFHLTSLISGSQPHAGGMMLRGQTLYVAAGDGDLQLFDISPWFDGRFSSSIELINYYSATGAVRIMEGGTGAVYAGTAFVYVGDNPAENPIAPNTKIYKLGGSVSTFVEDRLAVIDHVPEPNGRLWAGGAVEIQFNRIIDPELLRVHADERVEVMASGLRIPGIVSATVNNRGSRLFFRPMAPFADRTEYRITISSAITDIQGNTLGRDYRFRFIADAGKKPEINTVDPVQGSWRGGEPVVITGKNFGPESIVAFGGRQVPPGTSSAAREMKSKFGSRLFRKPPNRAGWWA